MKKVLRLSDLASYSKGQQINGDELLVDGEYDYLNGGIGPSGTWSDFNTEANSITISEGGNSCGFVNFMVEPFWCGAHCYFLYNIGGITKYLYYALKSQQERLMRIRSGACMPNIKKVDLGRFELLYDDDLDEQKKIVDVLDNTVKVIEKRKKELIAIDSIVKARFVEMFGDVQYARKYKGIQLRNLCTTVSGGTPSTRFPQYYEGDIPWISTVSLGQNHIDGTSAKGYITREAVANSATKLIPAGNILFGTRVGVGKSSLNDVDICINQDIVAIVGIDETKYSRLFIKHVLDSYQTYFNSIKKGATILGISGEDLKNILIPQVSIELQNQFADFVQQVDKSKDVAENTCNGAILML